MLGEKLRLLRENKKISREQIAEAIEVSTKTYIKYENNEAHPAHKIIQKIASYYEVNPADLEYGELKVQFVTIDNSKVEHQAQTINIHNEKIVSNLLELIEKLKAEIEELKK